MVNWRPDHCSSNVQRDSALFNLNFHEEHLRNFPSSPEILSVLDACHFHSSAHSLGTQCKSLLVLANLDACLIPGNQTYVCIMKYPYTLSFSRSLKLQRWFFRPPWTTSTTRTYAQTSTRSHSGFGVLYIGSLFRAILDEVSILSGFPLFNKFRSRRIKMKFPELSKRSVIYEDSREFSNHQCVQPQ